MNADSIEQALFDRALKTKIRAPRADRLANLGYNKIVTTAIIALSSLVCTFSLTSTSAEAPKTEFFGEAIVRPQMTQTDPADGSINHAPLRTNQPPIDPAIASVAMSQLSR